MAIGFVLRGISYILRIRRSAATGVSEENFAEVTTAKERETEVMANLKKVYTINEYTDTSNRGTYQSVLSRAYDFAPSNALLKTVVFGRGVIDRGVNMVGLGHKGPPTDEFINVNHHYAGIIHASGRVCGNNYHDCTPACPNVGTEVSLFDHFFSPHASQ